MSTATDLKRDVGQLLWIGFEGSEVTDDLARAIGDGEVGAVVLFARNLPRAGAQVDLPALAELDRQLHEHGRRAGDAPLWIAVDQEGGRVQRVREPATVWPPMLAFDAVAGDDAGLAESVGHALGSELAALGFDVDFAPVLDVHSNPQNPVIGDRAFAGAPEAVARRALAFARGLQRAGVVPCGKHFPGHGDTSTDSHLELPRLDHDRARLEAVELVPFRRAAEAGLPLLMTAHVVFAALDAEHPATLSPRVIQDLLRRDIGYSGVVVSDDLDMMAIAAHYGIGDAAVRSIRAGCDALLLCRDAAHQREAYQALLDAAGGDSALRARIGEAAQRIRTAKSRHAAATGDRPALAACGADEHRRLAAQLARTGADAG